MQKCNVSLLEVAKTWSRKDQDQAKVLSVALANNIYKTTWLGLEKGSFEVYHYLVKVTEMLGLGI